MTTVYTKIASPDGSPFHASEDCAPSESKRVECTLKEAYAANKRPCGKCCPGDMVESFLAMAYQ